MPAALPSFLVQVFRHPRSFCLQAGVQLSHRRWGRAPAGDTPNPALLGSLNRIIFRRPGGRKTAPNPRKFGFSRVSTDEELIEELSFPVYRRVSTMIFVPTESASSVEMVTVDPLDLQVAQERDLNHGT
jgi:hypothetical protein